MNNKKHFMIIINDVIMMFSNIVLLYDLMIKRDYQQRFDSHPKRKSIHELWVCNNFSFYKFMYVLL